MAVTAERALILKLKEEKSGNALLEAARDLDKLAQGADTAGASFKDMASDAEKLNVQIEESDKHIKDLQSQIARTGDQSLLGDLKKEQRFLADLQKISKEMKATEQSAAKITLGQPIVDAKSLNAELERAKVLVESLATSTGPPVISGNGRSDYADARAYLKDLERFADKVLPDITEAGASGAGLASKLATSVGDSALEAIGPLKLILIPGIVAAASELAVVAGAVIGGTISGAVGTAAMAAGLLSVSKDPAVKAAASDFGAVLKEEFFGKSQAFVQPAIDGLHILQSELVHLNVGDSLAKLAPTVTTIAHGLADFAENVMPGVNRTFDRMGPFANVAAEGLGDLGRNLGYFLDKVSGSPGAVEGLETGFKLLGGTIVIVGNGIRKLEDIYDGFVHQQIGMYKTIQGLADGLGLTGIGKVALEMRNMFQDVADGGPIASAAATAAGNAFQYYEDHVKDATDHTHDFIDAWNELNGGQMKLDEKLLAASRAVDEVKDTFDDGTKSVVGHSQAVLENRVALENAAQAAQEAAQAYLNEGGTAAGAQQILDEYKVSAEKATGATGGARDAVNQLADSLFKLQNKDITVAIHYKVTGAQLSKVENQLGDISGTRAGGGPVLAGRRYLVGENGPEPFVPTQNGYILPNSSLASMSGGGLSVGGGGTQTLQLTYVPSGNRLIDVLMEQLRIEVRGLGGPVAAFN